jgi:hypothetical protein
VSSTTYHKIASIGEGNRNWARMLVFELALFMDLSGEVELHGIDLDAVRHHEQLEKRIGSIAAI